MSQEKTQIFRGDDAPEMGIADTGEAVVSRKTNAPVDQRALRDQEGGPEHRRESRDAEDGPSNRRESHDAEGAAEQRRMNDADGLSDQRSMNDADGLSDQRSMNDADGLSDQRAMSDAEGLSDQRRMDDGDGLSELRQLHDHRAAIPEGGTGKPEVKLNFNDDEPEAPLAQPEAPVAKAAPAVPEVTNDDDLTFKVERDATPWALSIHLEERIANLGGMTTKVNQQLDALEESTRRLAKRIGK